MSPGLGSTVAMLASCWQCLACQRHSWCCFRPRWTRSSLFKAAAPGTSQATLSSLPGKGQATGPQLPSRGPSFSPPAPSLLHPASPSQLLPLLRIWAVGSEGQKELFSGALPSLVQLDTRLTRLRSWVKSRGAQAGTEQAAVRF